MQIKCIEIANFRRLASTHVDFDKKTTIFVGANNSGKTSAMVALRYFLIAPRSLALRDITLSNWPQIDRIGLAWEKIAPPPVHFDDLLPQLDVWLDVPLNQIRYVGHILPSLDWKGGELGVRLQFRPNDVEKLKVAYLAARESAATAAKFSLPDGKPLEMWPQSLAEFLARELHKHVSLQAFTFDPSARTEPLKGLARPQALPKARCRSISHRSKGLSRSMRSGAA